MKSLKSKFALLAILGLFFTYKSFAQVTDVDGKIYKTKKINTQIWMAENLNVSHFANGDLIPESKTVEDWVKAQDDGTPAWCYYNNDPIKGKKYGKLYNWYAVSDSRGLAPKGWHVPSSDEWFMLEEDVQISKYMPVGNDAGFAMKTLAGWNQKGNGNNVSGFSALPSGICIDGLFFKIGDATYWWSSSQQANADEDTQSAVYTGECVYLDLSENLTKHHANKGFGFSIRCVKNK